jgi:hypothetical protein
MAKKKNDPEPENDEFLDWEHNKEIAYKLVDLYVNELTERKDRQILDIEGLVEAYLYVLGRLKASEHEMGSIVKAIKDDIKRTPENPEDSGIEQAVGGDKKKLSAGLLKALEGM